MTQSTPLTSPAPNAVPDNRASYLSFGLAWLLGYGAFALSHGEDPRLPIPVAGVLLFGGLLIALIITGVTALRAQRGARDRAGTAGVMLAAAWLVGFGALSLLITALSSALNEPLVQTLLWPTASGLVVGMIHLASGAAHRDVTQYTLGAWLAVMSSAALFFDGANLYWALAVIGGGGYFAAAVRR
ncbi:ABC transporter permease [Nocardia sp. 2]|uniref:ABC transporter permease n=1 Tax=Nocardia acididurans TaxID=2802282 RepID=A0ABS1MFW5_9NOCA|nr:ABC transporter permease [Nocardia acididurans]MBL1079146.1 ABC transporter permease [Nocardia acididurans]